MLEHYCAWYLQCVESNAVAINWNTELIAFRNRFLLRCNILSIRFQSHVLLQGRSTSDFVYCAKRGFLVCQYLPQFPGPSARTSPLPAFLDLRAARPSVRGPISPALSFVLGIFRSRICWTKISLRYFVSDFHQSIYLRITIYSSSAGKARTELGRGDRIAQFPICTEIPRRLEQICQVTHNEDGKLTRGFEDLVSTRKLCLVVPADREWTAHESHFYMAWQVEINHCVNTQIQMTYNELAIIN